MLVGTSFLLFMLGFFSVLKKIMVFFLQWFIAWPLRAVSSFLFYTVIVKLYRAYFSSIKKLGWNDFRNSPLVFLLKQKLSHISVLVIVALLVWNNLTAKAVSEGSTEIANKTILASLVQSEFSTPDQERLVEEFFDAEPAISPIEQKYLDDISAVKAEPIINTKTSRADEPSEGGLALNEQGTAIVKQEVASTVKTKRQRKEIAYYTVESGDVIGMIADKFDLKVSTILWENNLTAYSIIRPGDKLTILQEDGITHKVAKGDSVDKLAKKYDVQKEDILLANKMSEGQTLAVGGKVFIPGARKTASAPVQVASRQSYSGLDVLKNLVSSKKPSVTASKGKYAWPTEGYRITQYYSWRHHGLDIGNKTGTPLYAIADGVIEVAGWGTGYGNTILVNHGNGLKTRYGHLSKFYVQKGDQVEKGEAIGLMGSTGWSTGPHLHFEYIVNGVKYNPLNYLR